VTGRNIDFGGWLRAIPQGMTYFGLAMIALIWGAVEFHLNVERERSEATAILSTGNLARMFEEQIVRLLPHQYAPSGAVSRVALSCRRRMPPIRRWISGSTATSGAVPTAKASLTNACRGPRMT